MYRRELILAIRRLPQSPKNIVKYCVRICIYNSKFIAVNRVGLTTYCECCVDHPFPYHMKVLGENRASYPRRYGHWVPYLN
jgi:hypothetical protein